MSVPYTFGNTPGGASIPLSELDSNFAYIESQLSNLPLQITPNIAGLRAIAPTTTYNVLTEGYYSNGDGGGGSFYAKVGAPTGTYVDNGGTIILPTGGDGSTAWIRILTGAPISVLAFGAKADFNGTTGTNSGPFFNKAMTYLSSVGGGTLFVPNGRYYIATSIIMLAGVTVTGESSSSLVGGTAYCSQLNVASGVHCFTLSNPTSAVVQVFDGGLENFEIIGITGALNAVNLPGGNASFYSYLLNYTIRELHVKNMQHAIYVGAYSNYQCITFYECEFAYQTQEHVYIADYAQSNEIAYYNCRFEQIVPNYSLLKIDSLNLGGGTHRFYNCVFEACSNLYAVYIGNNVTSALFSGCHFEANGIGQTNASNIYVGQGVGSVVCEACNFSLPFSTAVAFYHLKSFNSLYNIVLLNNLFSGATNVSGIVNVSGAYTRVTAIGNSYSGASWATTNPWGSCPSATRVNDFGSSTSIFGGTIGPTLNYVQTTNAAVTAIWNSGGYTFTANKVNSYLATAKVTCVSTTGTVYGAWSLQQLFTTDAANNATLRGNMDSTPVTTGGTLACNFAITGNGSVPYGLNLNVTGVAATTIVWTAEIKIYKINQP